MVEYMMFVTNDIIKQFAIGWVADLGKILLVSGQITIAFESINNPLDLIDQILTQESIPRWGGIC